MKLLARTAPLERRDYPLDGDVRIGSSAKCDITLAVKTVSREHAAVTVSGADVFIEDLKSTNGTLVNGERVGRTRLQHLDVISLGPDVDLIADLRLKGAAPAPVAAPIVEVAVPAPAGPGVAEPAEEWKTRMFSAQDLADAFADMPKPVVAAAPPKTEMLPMVPAAQPVAPTPPPPARVPDRTELLSPFASAPPEAAAAPAPRIRAVRLDVAGTTFEVGEGSHIIGRLEGADIVIIDRLVSRKHARLDVKHDAVLIEDLNSANGTSIGGKALKGPRLLEGGEIVSLGGLDCTVTIIRK